MAQKDLFHSCDIRTAIAPAVYTATEVGAIIDTQGYESLTFFIGSGTLTTGTWTAKIEDGDDAALSDAADVDSVFLLGTIADDATFAATDDDTSKKIGVVSKKRYVRLTLTGAATPNGLIGAQALLASPIHANIS
ncbi:MAG: hypothetical protein PVJ86_12885 [Phycisphaerales bacterium]|jgi:hypothetical protein